MAVEGVSWPQVQSEHQFFWGGGVKHHPSDGPLQQGVFSRKKGVVLVTGPGEGAHSGESCSKFVRWGVQCTVPLTSRGQSFLRLLTANGISLNPQTLLADTGHRLGREQETDPSDSINHLEIVPRVLRCARR